MNNSNNNNNNNNNNNSYYNEKKNSNNCLQKITIIVLIFRIGMSHQIPCIKSYRSRILKVVAFHLSE